MKHYFFITTLLLILSCFCVKTKIDNSLEVWIDNSSFKTKKWQQYKKNFGSSEYIVVAVTYQKLDQKTIEDITDLEKKLEKLSGVKSIIGPGKLYVQMFDYDMDGKGDEIEDLILELQKSPFYKGLLAGKSILGIFLRLLPNKPAFRRKIVAAIKKEISLVKNPSLSFHLAGPPVLNAQLDFSSQKTSKELIPITIAVVLISIALIVHSLWVSFAVLLALGCAIGATIGTMAIFSTSLNMLNISLPALLFVLGGANAIHIVYKAMYLNRQTDSFAQAVSLATKELFYPCTAATLTTAVGFASFSISPIAAIQQLGIYMALGLSFTLLANLYILPALLSLKKSYPCYRPTILSKLAVALGNKGSRHPYFIAATSIALVSLCVPMFSKIQVESNVLRFLPKDHVLNKDYKVISNKLTGLFSIEVQVDIKEPGKTPWLWLDNFAKRLQENPAITRVYSPVDLLKKIKSESLGKTIHQLTPNTNVDILIISMEGMLAQEWNRLVKDGGRKMNLSILVSDMSSMSYQKILQLLDQEIKKAPLGIQLETTGIIVLINEAQKALIYTQLQSFAIAGGLICLMLFLCIPNKKLALIAISINLLPPIFTFALMAIGGVELNAGTVMVVSVAIGISVDDTIHFCHRYLLNKEQNLEQTLSATGPAMITTTFAIACGFLVLLCSPFQPLMYFGVLIAISVVMALISDLIVLPAFITLWRGKNG